MRWSLTENWHSVFVRIGRGLEWIVPMSIARIQRLLIDRSPLLSKSRRSLSIQYFAVYQSRRTMATAMSKRLEGKTILITGASSGIGKSTGFRAPAGLWSSGLTELSNGICTNLPEKSQAHFDRAEDWYPKGSCRKYQIWSGRRCTCSAIEAGRKQSERSSGLCRLSTGRVQRSWCIGEQCVNMALSNPHWAASLMHGYSQGTCQRHSESARYLRGWCWCDVFYKCHGSDQHDPGSAPYIQEARGWGPRRRYQYWQHRWKGSVSWGLNILCIQSSNTKLHWCHTKRVGCYQNKSHRDWSWTGRNSKQIVYLVGH